MRLSGVAMAGRDGVAADARCRLFNIAHRKDQVKQNGDTP